jgi:hypothetical protein
MLLIFSINLVKLNKVWLEKKNTKRLIIQYDETDEVKIKDVVESEHNEKLFFSVSNVCDVVESEHQSGTLIC